MKDITQGLSKKRKACVFAQPEDQNVLVLGQQSFQKNSKTKTSQSNYQTELNAIPLGYAICLSNICVRSGCSKKSEVVTNLEVGSCVLVLETHQKRAKIYFEEKIGWCTIFMENQKRYLLKHASNQEKAKALFESQYTDPVEIYESDFVAPHYLDYEFDISRNTKRKSNEKHFKKRSNFGVEGYFQDLLTWKNGFVK